MNVVTGEKWERVYRVACSAESIDPLVSSLVDVCLPEPFYAILTGHWFGDRVDTYMSAFLPRARMEAVIAPHLPLLVHDGMVGYGFAWDDGAQHEEVFIDDHKELTVLTSKPKAVEDSLARYGLARIDGLDFISEHSHGHLNLGGPEASYCHQIIQLLGMERVPLPEDV
jgi:hypothetical protein